MELKSLSYDSIDSAIEKAKHYRLLNDPENAESICLDILSVDSDHQEALIVLILAITDQFMGGSRIKEARQYLARVTDDFNQAYFAGLICERAAKSILAKNNPGAREAAFEWLQDAMEHFMKSDSFEHDDDDPILRWNSCARMINKHQLRAPKEESFTPYHD